MSSSDEEIDVITQGKPTKKPRKRPGKHLDSWIDIFSRCMLLVSSRFSGTGEIFGSNLTIEFFDEEFTRTFGFEQLLENEFLPFDMLLKAASRPEKIQVFNSSMQSGQPATEYINLYKRDGIPISCHVTLQPITRSYPDCNLTHSKVSIQMSWAVMAIRSASVVGNASCFGIGYYPLSRTPDFIKDEILAILTNKDTEAKRKRPKT